ncbi:MAG: hypothetical protein UV54_C0027G0009 [Candidatus Beckwithbacteria bacterium GW2011_GWA2_43_10]|uniref:Phage-Barnase-EndoU-ColicinE5/D-RelE like nuclease 3 domain-containing protein n=1 Tax=Candidatus Beckwithbacteria bacterium GW2011_GWA2_43_10 TaxID=1618369 RepID=A0A0G1C2T2_9BACT|nr:MAG: hypothetical protein UV54_C0027G0009 [Candidatus Beckwithbacteria bacterium GW2011_GWA2_43_10]
MVLTMDVQIDIKEVTIEFNEEKNLLLKETRKISFDEIIEAIDKNQILDDIEHRDKKRYLQQKILVVRVKNYVYAILYVRDKKRGVIFLKTIYPSRVLTKKYIK